MHTLRTEDRAFLELVTRAIYANPFSEERIGIDRELGGLRASAPPRQHLDAAIERVRTFIRTLDASDRTSLGSFRPEDRTLMESVYLFSLFHEYLDRLDSLIRAQSGTESPIGPVPFGKDALCQLEARGFTPNRARIILAMFFQIRRAFFFICESLVGVSPSMKALRRALWANVFTQDMQLYSERLWSRMEDFSTMILGETGTGKGAAAAAIGRSGFIPFNPSTGRFETSFMESFVSINLSQFPESLIESELFGHRKGAFTGAIEPHKGIFARCSPFGAIFLDEIGDVSVPVQIKLLRVLQDRVFSPVGCHTQEQFRGRVIAASNRSIEELRRTGRFRDDFYYRLCSDVIEVPTLRQRIRECPEELDLLLGIVTNRILGTSFSANPRGDTTPDIAKSVRKILDRDIRPDYGWPGNVRELEQSVRRILLSGAYRGERTLSRDSTGDSLINRMSLGLCSADELLGGYCRLLYDQHGTVQEVARRLQLDRRTVTRHIRNDRGEQRRPAEPPASPES